MSDVSIPDRSALLLADMYIEAGVDAVLGGFEGGSAEVRVSLLARFSDRPLPEPLLRAAVESRDEQVWWALSQRTDLPEDVVALLVTDGSDMVRTHMAEHPQIHRKQMEPLMPGTAAIRVKLFQNPMAPVSLRKGIAQRSRGKYMSSRLAEVLASPEFVPWCVEADDTLIVGRALQMIGELPPAWQWDVAKILSRQPGVVVAELLELGGWVPDLQRLLAEASATEKLYGSKVASELLDRRLDSYGRPDASQAEEASMLPDVSEVHLLASPTLDWHALEKSVKDGRVTVAAVRYLLGRDDRPISFVAAAVIRYGTAPGLIRGLSVEEVNAAVATSVVKPREQARLLDLLLKSRPAGSRLLDVLARFCVYDVFVAVEGAGQTTASLRQALAHELAEEFGKVPEVWSAFEQQRELHPKMELGRMISECRDCAELPAR